MPPNSIRLRQLSQLDYLDPIEFLKMLRSLDEIVSASKTPDRVKRLRTGLLKPVRELRDAALFCAGMSEVCGQKIWMAGIEDQDFDFVASWSVGDAQHIRPVQLKELPPEDLNANSSIQVIIEKLSSYADSLDLTVAIKLGRNMRFDPKVISVPDDLTVGEIWVFGAIEPDQSKWALWGDFKTGSVTEGRVFDYPR